MLKVVMEIHLLKNDWRWMINFTPKNSLGNFEIKIVATNKSPPSPPPPPKPVYLEEHFVLIFFPSFATRWSGYSAWGSLTSAPGTANIFFPAALPGAGWCRKWARVTPFWTRTARLSLAPIWGWLRDAAVILRRSPARGPQTRLLIYRVLLSRKLLTKAAERGFVWMGVGVFPIPENLGEVQMS